MLQNRGAQNGLPRGGSVLSGGEIVWQSRFAPPGRGLQVVLGPRRPLKMILGAFLDPKSMKMHPKFDAKIDAEKAMNNQEK